MAPTAAAPAADPPVRSAPPPVTDRPAAAAADPRQLAAELERAVLPLPPAERRAVLARLVALAADPEPAPEPTATDPCPTLEELAEELTVLEEHYPKPAAEEVYADWAWIDRQWVTPAVEPYRGRWVVVLDREILAADPNPLLLLVEWSKRLGVSPQRLVLKFIPVPGPW